MFSQSFLDEITKTAGDWRKMLGSAARSVGHFGGDLTRGAAGAAGGALVGTLAGGALGHLAGTYRDDVSLTNMADDVTGGNSDHISNLIKGTLGKDTLDAGHDSLLRAATQFETAHSPKGNAIHAGNELARLLPDGLRPLGPTATRGLGVGTPLGALLGGAAGFSAGVRHRTKTNELIAKQRLEDWRKADMLAAALGRQMKTAAILPHLVAGHQLATGSMMKQELAKAQGQKHPLRSAVKGLGLGALGLVGAALTRQLLMSGHHGGSVLPDAHGFADSARQHAVNLINAHKSPLGQP